MVDGVPATSCLGEQAIRPAVVHREIPGGILTWAGARTQGVITSVIATAIKRSVDIIAYLAGRAGGLGPGLTILNVS